MVNDYFYMAKALQLAEKGLYTTKPNPCVGCIIVKDNKIIGEGYHHKAGEPHAEVYALQQAKEQAENATVYVTLEPCSHYGKTPPCVNQLIKAKVKRVVIAMQDPNPLVQGQGIALLKQSGIEVEVDVLKAQAYKLNQAFIKRMTKKIPWLRIKMAMSLDGKTALNSGESQWISGQASRQDVHKWRARSGAIVTGVGTVLADNPLLNARIDNDDTIIQPLRCVIDTHLRIPLVSNLLSIPSPVIIYTSAKPPPIKPPSWVEFITMPKNEYGIDLKAVLQDLAQREVNEIQVEAGAKLAGSLWEQALVDEMLLYIAPQFLGDKAKPLLALPELQSMQARYHLTIQDIRMLGEDIRILLNKK